MINHEPAREEATAMYTQRIVHIPAVGKGPELRRALEERNASGNAAAPHALSVNMFAISPAYVHSIRFDNLAAIEAYQNSHLQDPAFMAQANKISQYLAQERVSFLYEELGGTPVTGKASFLVRNRYCPAAGKGQELRDALTERIQKGEAGLAGARLSRQMWSIDGPALAVTLLFGSMADIDKFRAAQEKDASFMPYVNKVASLCRTPFQQRFQRILAPFPS
jgi:hypothetical protein